MEDRQIIELYWERAEEAIRETDVKYGRLCRYIAQNILASPDGLLGPLPVELYNLSVLHIKPPFPC